jgi:hypothetical protein
MMYSQFVAVSTGLRRQFLVREHQVFAKLRQVAQALLGLLQSRSRGWNGPSEKETQIGVSDCKFVVSAPSIVESLHAQCNATHDRYLPSGAKSIQSPVTVGVQVAPQEYSRLIVILAIQHEFRKHGSWAVTRRRAVIPFLVIDQFAATVL